MIKDEEDSRRVIEYYSSEDFADNSSNEMSST